MQKINLLLLCSCLLSIAASAFAQSTHLEQLKVRYPFGLIGSDYDLLTEEDLAINTCKGEVAPFLTEKNMAYPYWQCFLVKNAKMECESSGYDPLIKREVAHMGVDAKGEDGSLHSYTARDGMDITDCRHWVRSWKRKTRGEKYVCLSGPYGGFSGVREGRKETDWVFDKFKTRKGCESFFDGDCQLEAQASGTCILPENWVSRTHPTGVSDSSIYKGSPIVNGELSATDLLRKYPKIEPDKKLKDMLTAILNDQGKSLHLSTSMKLEHFNSGKFEVPIWIGIPPNCEKTVCPVIVHVYGDNSCFIGGYHWRPEFFLQAGFIVAEPNMRGSSCPNKQWQEAAKGKLKFNALTDIQACGEFLKERFKQRGQAPKIGVVGWSYGGLVALTAMTRFAGSFDAGVALAAKTDLYSFFKSAPPSLRKAREAKYGDPDRDAQLFKDLSPITYAGQVSAPIALMLGGMDPKVSLSDADAFVTKLHNLGKDISLMIVPEHGHLTEKPKEIIFEHAYVIEFFSKKFGYPITFQH